MKMLHYEQIYSSNDASCKNIRRRMQQTVHIVCQNKAILGKIMTAYQEQISIKQSADSMWCNGATYALQLAVNQCKAGHMT